MSNRKNKSEDMKGIYLRGNIYWYAPPMRHGKHEPYVTLETSDLTEAIKRAKEIRENPLLSASEGLEQEAKNCAAYKLRMKEWTEASVESKQAVLRAFARTQPAGHTAANVTTTAIQKYHDGLMKTLTPSTVNGYMMTLRSFFNWCVDVQRLIRRSPMDAVKVVKTVGRAREDFATFELRDKLIADTPDDDLRFILYMGFHAGLRKREIIEARPFWFDLPNGMLHLRMTATMRFKDKEERSIPMTADFQKFMQSYGLREPFLLKPEVKPGKGKYRYDFRKPFEDYMKAQGCVWLTPHIMRHTFASLLATSGVSIYKVALWLGDDVKTVQKHYAKLVPGDKDIERAFGQRHAAMGSGAGAA